MKFVLELNNPSDWEILLSFLQQKGIDFRLKGKKKEKPKTQNATPNETALEQTNLAEGQIINNGEKLLKDIKWEFAHHTFQMPKGTTFCREEIYEDAD